MKLNKEKNRYILSLTYMEMATLKAAFDAAGELQDYSVGNVYRDVQLLHKKLCKELEAQNETNKTKTRK